jgi:serine/threonine protein kinase
MVHSLSSFEGHAVRNAALFLALGDPKDAVRQQNRCVEYRYSGFYLGILTYELLYGRVPFEIRTEDDLVKVVDEEIYFPKSIPITSGAKDFILKCLLKNPKERLPMLKLVDHEFIQTH